MRAVFLAPAAVFFALAGFFLIALFWNDGNELPSMLVGHEMRPFDLPVLGVTPDSSADAGRVTDTDLKDGQMTVVNFWASWCGPCRNEHGALLGLQQSGVRVLGVNYKDEAVDARKFLADLGNPFERVGVDRDGRTGIDWGITGVPETFVVDGSGLVIARIVGPLTSSDMHDLMRMAGRDPANVNPAP